MIVNIIAVLTCKHRYAQSVMYSETGCNMYVHRQLIYAETRSAAGQCFMSKCDVHVWTCGQCMANYSMILDLTGHVVVCWHCVHGDLPDLLNRSKRSVYRFTQVGERQFLRIIP